MVDWQKWTIEQVITHISGKIGKANKWIFGWALFFGALTHFYMFVNKLPNGDDLEFVYRDFTMTTSGRWFDLAATSLSSWYSVPWLTGIVTILLLAFSVAFLADLLEIKRRLSGFLLAAIMVTFPVLAANFSYLFYADLYMMALLLAVLAVWFCVRFKWGFLIGALLLCCALGAYQAYVSISIVVCLLVLIKVVIKEQTDNKRLLVLIGKMALMGILAVLWYFMILKGLLALWHLELTDYQGINTMGQKSSIGLNAILLQCYLAFGEYFFGETFFPSPLAVKIAYGLLLVLAVFWLIRGLCRRKSQKLQLLLLAFFLLALPIGFNIIFIMAPESTLHCLMQPAYMLFFALPVFCFEWAYLEKQQPKSDEVVSSWLLLLFTAIVAFYFFVVCNVCYLHLQMRYEITYAAEVRIMARIETMPEYSPDMPVYFVGSFPNEYYSLYPSETYDMVKGLTGIKGNLVHHQKNYEGFYRTYLGWPLIWASEEQQAEIKAYLAENPMPRWPMEGSIKIIDDVMVVNIGPER